jgi:hypothetical protein
LLLSHADTAVFHFKMNRNAVIVLVDNRSQ